MARSSNSTEVVPAKSARRKLDFDGPRITRSQTEFDQASPTWKNAKGKRVYFGERGVSTFLQCLGPFLLQSQPCSGRMVFTPHQKADLEEVFQKTKYPSRREKETMSKLFGVPKKKIEAWFSKRRLKWQKSAERFRRSRLWFAFKGFGTRHWTRCLLSLRPDHSNTSTRLRHQTSHSIAKSSTLSVICLQSPSTLSRKLLLDYSSVFVSSLRTCSDS
ncbi:PREDICTED: paired box protein Pax-6-like [Acropora digitifera]|uniref:paired box protein Pax-6-like n=1 Tax=Acropora digitifera TaxID=70779 RepID=UPI00077A3974|nr:PREDICTED: paired box protein Pax-6-like [Acropora digitifera]